MFLLTFNKTVIKCLKLIKLKVQIWLTKILNMFPTIIKCRCLCILEIHKFLNYLLIKFNRIIKVSYIVYAIHRIIIILNCSNPKDYLKLFSLINLMFSFIHLA